MNSNPTVNLCPDTSLIFLSIIASSTQLLLLLKFTISIKLLNNGAPMETNPGKDVQKAVFILKNS